MRAAIGLIEGLARIIEHQVDLAQYFYDRLKGISHIELAPRSPTNVVCFRFSPSGIDKRKHEVWQTEFQRRLEVHSDGSTFESISFITIYKRNM
jgi:glutamate/tyrosine decarboxylase-like PLP-dependent enzyme